MIRKRSEAEIAADRARLARLGRRYRLAILLGAVAAVLFAFWSLGYSAGYLDGWNNRRTAFEKESN